MTREGPLPGRAIIDGKTIHVHDITDRRSLIRNFRIHREQALGYRFAHDTSYANGS